MCFRAQNEKYEARKCDFNSMQQTLQNANCVLDTVDRSARVVLEVTYKYKIK